MIFDWDDGNRDKCQRHGVSIEEIEAFFLGDPRFAPDVKHSQTEDRYIAVGRTAAAARALFVAFTLRKIGNEEAVRPVSARYMHEEEIAGYEAQSSKDDD